MKELKQTLQLLANGPASYIVREMESSIDEIDQICAMFPTKISWIEPEAKTSKNAIRAQIESAQTHVLPLEHTERDIRNKESKPGLKRYFILQQKIEDPQTNEYQIPTLQREASGLKAAFSRELVDLVKKSHDALTFRLKIIENWKEVVNEEIGFMEAIQEELLRRILGDAHREGLTSIVDQIQERLTYLSKRAYIQSHTLRPSEMKFGNIKKLQSHLKVQLQDVVKLEKEIIEKYGILSELASIENSINNDLPEEPAYKTHYKTIPSTQTSGIRPQQTVTRMAFGKLQPRTA